ncbi:MAG: hypothetical protein AUK46_04820 [Flavobacteriaceae bacterium CG2_30_31_66]|nr:MAG: hypothetical protein AUK46_04820 [Flavobacteriaceae bacterium CG2_30_31_66]
MISSNKITEIYFITDEFHKEFEKAKLGRILDCETGLIAYSFFDKKPSLNIEIVKNGINA